MYTRMAKVACFRLLCCCPRSRYAQKHPEIEVGMELLALAGAGRTIELSQTAATFAEEMVGELLKKRPLTLTLRRQTDAGGHRERG